MKGTFKITLPYLRELGACRAGQREFQKAFPDGGEYQEVLDRCAEEGRLDFGRWLLDHIGPTDDVRIYDATLDTQERGIIFAGKIEFRSGVSYAFFVGINFTAIYDAALAKVEKQLNTGSRNHPASASIGTHALFGGGYSTTQNESLSSMFAYDDVTTEKEVTPLISSMSYPAAASNEKYAIFGGDTCVNAYDENLTRSIATGLSKARSHLSAARAGNYILFAGGQYPSMLYTLDTVDAYDLFLTRTTVETLKEPCTDLAGATVRDFAVFGGGHPSVSNKSIGVWGVTAYDPYLVRTTPKNISEGRGQLAAVSIGDYALFGGGEYYKDSIGRTQYSGVVDAYRYT